MRHHRREGKLLINGRDVGHVSAESVSESWGFGQFTPAPEFSDFAPLFGAWAMLLHEEDDRDRLSPEARRELAVAEAAIDQLKTELHWVDSTEPVSIHQVAIDGKMIEWNH